MASTSEVPGKYDLALTVGATTTGYTFLRTLDGSYLSASRGRAEYTSTQTFVERQNTSGAYGDDQQAFFLTASQTDWSLGEGQNFLNVADADSLRKYQSGTGIDCSNPGYVTHQYATKTATSMTFAMKAACGCGQKIGVNTHAAASSTNIYTVGTGGTATDQGAHGAGTPNQWGMCSDGVNVYIAGASKIRKWTGAAFSDFSAATNAGSIAFLNNALYSCDGSTLKTYDGAGTATTLFTWKDATNTALTALDRKPKLVPFGGKLLIFFDSLIDRGELWLYDGVGTSKVAELTEGVTGYDCLVAEGVVYMSASDGNLWFWVNGQIGRVIVNGGTANLPLGVYNGKVLFGAGKRYDISTAAIDTIGFSSGEWISSTPTSVLVSFNSATAPQLWPDTSAYKTAVSFVLSAIDLGNTLTKLFRSVKVDFESSINDYPVGFGSPSIDISYVVDKFAGHLTAGFTGVTSGDDNLFPSATKGRSITLVVTLNNPTAGGQGYIRLKKVYLRSAPVLQSYKVRTYNLDLSSTDTHPTVLQDGSFQTLSGFTQAQNLQTAIASTTPITITDKFGTFTGVCEPAQCSILELHSEGSTPTTPGQYVAQLTVREV